MNKVILIGRLTRDPEVRSTTSAEPILIARYTLAVDRRNKREGRPTADFIPCVSFGKQAEFVDKYFKKGSQMAVVGRIDVNASDDGKGNRTYFTSVIVEEISFTESRAASEARSSAQNDYYDSMAEQYTPPSSSAPPVADIPPANAAPEGFAEIKDSIDDDEDLPF
ncbi:MAG: single-stranded DNA-binding protein [Defluviitaleaceae bacterium]|nr:single-stranded DNA-binding protein [Defluviitaleaceae bacterium]